MIDEPFLFEDLPHARATDPLTSHEAVPTNISAQAFTVLTAYRTGRELLDHDAYRLVGLGSADRLAHQRCSDLRAAGLIERTGNRGQTPSGKAGYLCAITDLGRAYLAERGIGDEVLLS